MSPLRTAFVLGAGLGTRLKSLTARRPKPLLPVVNRPLIGCAFDHLLGSGVERFVVNTHWRAESYQTAFPGDTYRGRPITFRHEWPEILETAGGIKHAAALLGDAPFFVYNGDILSDLPLAPALAQHAASGCEVTLILRSRGGPLQVACDGGGRVTDIGGHVDPAAGPRFLFTGIYLVNPAFVQRIPPGEKLSVIPLFCEMIRSGAALGGIVIDCGHWWDLGTREEYLAVHRWLKTEGRRANEWLAPTANLAPTATLSGATAIGPGARIGEGAVLRDCLVWNDAEVAPGAVLERCIVTDGKRAEGTHTDHDF